MDTQRLILWLIFSFSGLLLWQAWERERNPVPVPAASAPAPRSAESSAAPSPAAPSPAAPSTVAPTAAPPVAPTAAAGQTVEVRTDLYVADIDSVGGTIARVALDKHRDAQDPSKPYLALQRN